MSVKINTFLDNLSGWNSKELHSKFKIFVEFSVKMRQTKNIPSFGTIPSVSRNFPVGSFTLYSRYDKFHTTLALDIVAKIWALFTSLFAVNFENEKLYKNFTKLSTCYWGWVIFWVKYQNKLFETSIVVAWIRSQLLFYKHKQKQKIFLQLGAFDF